MAELADASDSKSDSCTRVRVRPPLRAPNKIVGSNLKFSKSCFCIFAWRDDRAAYCAALEMLCTGNSTEGSNPSLSAMKS